MNKKKSDSQSAFFNLRTLVSVSLCLFGFVMTLVAAGVIPGKANKITRTSKGAALVPQQAKAGSQKPDVVALLGPVSQDLDLRLLPYMPPNEESEDEEGPRRRHPFPLPVTDSPINTGTKFINRVVQSALAPKTPSPLLTFDGIDSTLSGCGCLPPDTDGDVGPNHYIASVNSSIGVYDKSGNALLNPVTYNSFFAAMGTSTPCGNNQNNGDGVVFYDHMADRWVVSDFAFGSAFPGAGPFVQCIGVSKTSDPVTGGWYLYSVPVDPSNPSWLGDYPKFGLWPDAYYMTVNMFVNNTTFTGVRVYAFDRSAMINGGAANTIAFTITPADLGDQYSLVPASFRTGAPPAGQPEWFMDVNSPGAAGVVQNQVFVRRFHVDFVTPANSTFGVGAGHTPDGIVTVNNFVDAFTSTTSNLVPNGTATTTQWVDTLGDKIMYPLVYQNINGQEYIYGVQTVAPGNNGTTNTLPTAIRWYQFDMTGNTIPATPTQQQDWTNGNDGLYRCMPSINVDGSGNMAIGYTAASTTVNPGIRYAGRLSTDPPNNLTQGEAVMTAATGHQTSTQGRWGDYSSMFVDPNDNCTFWHTNEYYSANGGASWRTRIGTFKFGQCTGSPPATPTPTPTGTPTPTPSPTPTPTPTATPSTSPTPSPTPPGSAGPITIVATAGTTGPTDYASLQAGFAAINAGTHQGAIQVWIMADTVETVTALLNAPVAPASYTSVLVLPNGTRNVSGNIVSAGLITLDGAKNVRIDGYNNLTLSNTNTGATANTSTIRLVSSLAANGGAQNNIIANCNIQGGSTVPVGTTAGGTVLIHNTVASGTTIVGNNNNIIANNNIGPAGASLPTKAICAVGTTTNANVINTGNVITNNNIFDFFNTGASTTGIDIRTGNTAFTISNNRIYQTATRTFASTALRYAGITFVGSTGAGSTGNSGNIIGNTIGFGAADGTGTTTITGSSNEVRGIDIQAASSGTATSVSGNIISGINQTSSRASASTGLSAFAGIQVANAAGTGAATGVFDIGTQAGNTIGSLDGSSTIVINATSTTASTAPVFGILGLSTGSNFINNNKIGAITIQSTGTVTGFRGIFPGASANTTQTINDNIIGGPAAAGAIVDTQVGDYAVYGVQSGTAAVSINRNLIRNMSGNATSSTAGTVVLSGFAISTTGTSTAVSNISQNIVHSLRNDTSSANVAAIYGIDLTMSTTAALNANLVERNQVHSLTMTSGSTGSQLYGMIMRGSGAATFQNNMIRLGLDKDGNSITSGFLIRGIRDSAGNTSSYYFNSVYIGGTGVASASNTTAFFSDVVTNTRNYRNNIFWNARSNASGAGKNYAIAVGGITPNPAGLTSNNNDLYVSGTGGFVGLFNATDQTTLANWQTATGQDANSISADPVFVNANGTAATGDLHLQSSSPVLSLGVSIAATTASPLTGIGNDIDNDTRPATPDMGADEISLAAAPVLQSAVSRLTHGGAGPFDLPLSLASRTIEPRNGSGSFSVIFTFDGPVTSGTASIMAGTATIGGTTFSGNTMTVTLTSVPDINAVTLKLNNVAGPGTSTTSPSIQIGFLIGDVSQDSTVNVGDTVPTRNHSGETLDNTNFQYDVNVDGLINVGDAIVVRSKSGDFIP